MFYDDRCDNKRGKEYLSLSSHGLLDRSILLDDTPILSSLSTNNARHRGQKSRPDHLVLVPFAIHAMSKPDAPDCVVSARVSQCEILRLTNIQVGAVACAQMPPSMAFEYNSPWQANLLGSISLMPPAHPK